MNVFTKNIEELLCLTSKKVNLVRHLKKNYKENIHYIILKCNEKITPRGGHNKITFMLTENTFILLKNSFNLRNKYIVDCADNFNYVNIGMCIETQTIGFIENSFKDIITTKRQHTIGTYRVDLYFPEYLLVVECDENSHDDRDPIYEKNREDYILSQGNKIIRYNPNITNFDLSNVLIEINKILLINNPIKIIEHEILDEPILNISTHEMVCQPDFNDTVPMSYPIITTNDELYKKFDLYVEECCLIRENCEVNSNDIIGQFRIWNKNVSNDIKIALFDYLKQRFNPIKMKKQDKHEIQYGYEGLMLKRIDYGKVVFTNDIEVFVYEKCRFSPSGISYIKTLMNEYKRWKQNTSRPYISTDEKELRNYLNNHPHLLASVVQTPIERIINEDGTITEIENNTSSNEGYYGIYLKCEDEHHYKNTSSTGKRVEMRDYATDTVLATYETIAKAILETKLTITVMRKAIKDKIVFNNDHYFCIANKYV